MTVSYKSAWFWVIAAWLAGFVLGNCINMVRVCRKAETPAERYRYTHYRSEDVQGPDYAYQVEYGHIQRREGDTWVHVRDIQWETGKREHESNCAFCGKVIDSRLEFPYCDRECAGLASLWPDKNDVITLSEGTRANWKELEFNHDRGDFEINVGTEPLTINTGTGSFAIEDANVGPLKLTATDLNAEPNSVVVNGVVIDWLSVPVGATVTGITWEAAVIRELEQ